MQADKPVEFRELCRRHGLALTHQRAVIYDSLMSFAGHPSPEEVYERVRKLIYQAPWYRDGVHAGLVELSLELPADMPHFVRDLEGSSAEGRDTTT